MTREGFQRELAAMKAKAEERRQLVERLRESPVVFGGDEAGDRAIAVHRNTHPNAPPWRVTSLIREGIRDQWTPIGHTEHRSYGDAIKGAVECGARMGRVLMSAPAVPLGEESR